MKPISEWTERDYIECDYDEMTDSEIMVLLIMEPGKPVSKTRLKYIALLYDELYGSKRREDEQQGDEKMNDETENKGKMPERIKAMVLMNAADACGDVLAHMLKEDVERIGPLEDALIDACDVHDGLKSEYEGQLVGREPDCVLAVSAYYLTELAMIYMKKVLAIAKQLDDKELLGKAVEIRMGMYDLKDFVQEEHPLSRYGVEKEHVESENECSGGSK